MKIDKIIVWFMLGIIACCSITMANLSGAKSVFDDFYTSKKVYECDASYYKNNPQVRNGNWNIDIDNYSNFLYFGQLSTKWNYFYIDIDDMNCNSVDAYFNYYNSENDMELLQMQEVELVEGENIIKTACKRFDCIGVIFVNQAGKCFRVNNIQIRQSKPIPNLAKRFFEQFVLFFVAYMALSILLFPIIIKFPLSAGLNWLIEKLLIFFEAVNNHVYYFVSKCPKNIRSIIRVLSFLFVLIYFNLTSVHLVFPLSSWSRTLTLSLIMLVVAFSLSQIPVRKQNWKTPLVRWWFLYNICTIVSDLVVRKKIMFQGLVLLFVFGFLIFCWNNQESLSGFLREIFISVHFYFLIMIICCFFLRPETDARYQGTFSNPVTFGAYVAMISVIIMIELVTEMKIACFSRKYFLLIIELLIALSFVWKTQARSAILPVLIVILLLSWKYLFYNNYYKKKFVCTSGIVIILALPVYFSVDYIIKNVPVKLGTELTFVEDKKISDDQFILKEDFIDAYKVDAAILEDKENDSRLFQKFNVDSLDELTSGRTLFWKGYLRQMNLFGHYHYAYVMGKKQHPHCSLFMIAYRYGVFTVIPYIFVLVYAFLEAIRYLLRDTYMKHMDYAECPIGVVCVFLSISLIDVAEYLYSGFGWLLFNLIIGILFIERKSMNDI